MTETNLLRISELVSTDLISRNGDVLGQVTDILINPQDHRAEYLMVKLVDEEEPVSLRYSAAVVDKARGCFVLNVGSDVAKHMLH